MPAPTRHGKTTLAAWLTRGPFDCLTDELVYLPEGSSRIHELARPRLAPEVTAMS